MPTLSSWKEIAQYLGKGVRTVQRWERQLGLPVRRPAGRAKGVVLALTDELDNWMGSQWSKSEVELLRSELVKLREENEALRARLAVAESAASILSPNKSGRDGEY